MSLAFEALAAFLALFVVSTALGLGAVAMTRFRLPRGLAPVIGLAITIWLSCAGLFAGVPAWATGAVVGAVALAALALALVRGVHRGVRLHSLVICGMAAIMSVAVSVTAAITEGRVGIPGVALNNDLANHLKQIEYYIDPSAFSHTPIWEWYPTAGHAVVATLVAPLGLDPVAGVNALMWATVAATACTGVVALRRLPPVLRVLSGTLVGIPYLIAGYVGQGAFKEPLVAAFLVGAVVMVVMRPRGRREFMAWPFVALMCVVSALVYSYVGVAWIAGALAVALLLTVLRTIVVGRGRVVDRLLVILRGAWLPACTFVGSALVLGLPFASNFWTTSQGTDAGVLQEAGNLVGPLSPLQWFGTWPSFDFRVDAFLAADSNAVVALVGLCLIGAAAGLILARAAAYLSALAAGILLYAYLAHSSSWYFTAKGLVALSPLVMVCIFVGLHAVWASPVVPRLVRGMTAVLASATCVLGILSSLIVQAGSPVGPMDHVDQLRSLRGKVAGSSVLFLGDDDFIDWELAGAFVYPVLDGNRTGLPASRIWNMDRKPSPGAPLDIDYLLPSFLERFDYVIAPTASPESAPPPGTTVVARTRDYEVWQLPPRVPTRLATPDSGISPVGLVACGAGRPFGKDALARRADAVFTAAPGEIPPGESAVVTLALSRGRWDLAVQYYSANAVRVESAGRHFDLSPLMMRPGPFWSIGSIDVASAGDVTVRFTVDDAWPYSPEKSPLVKKSRFGQLGAIRVNGLSRGTRAGCGKSADWVYAGQ